MSSTVKGSFGYRSTDQLARSVYLFTLFTMCSVCSVVSYDNADYIIEICIPAYYFGPLLASWKIGKRLPVVLPLLGCCWKLLLPNRVDRNRRPSPLAELPCKSRRSRSKCLHLQTRQATSRACTKSTTMSSDTLLSGFRLCKELMIRYTQSFTCLRVRVRCQG